MTRDSHSDCSEWRHCRLPCRHFHLIFSCLPGWNWDKLSPLYHASLLLNLDYITLSSSMTEALYDDREDMLEANIPEDDDADTLQKQNLPLPPRKRSKTKMLQIHCRTIIRKTYRCNLPDKRPKAPWLSWFKALIACMEKQNPWCPVKMEYQWKMSPHWKEEERWKKSYDAKEQGTEEQSTIILPPLQADGGKKTCSKWSFRCQGGMAKKIDWAGEEVLWLSSLKSTHPGPEKTCCNWRTKKKETQGACWALYWLLWKRLPTMRLLKNQFCKPPVTFPRLPNSHVC